MTPFLIGQTFTANEMNDFIGGKHQGGIRYSGNFPDLRRIGIVIGGGADAIYPDELHGSTITYIGEGQEGEQKLTYGNRALVWAHFHEMPVHVFINRGKSRYEYRGEYRVRSVTTTIAPDRHNLDRSVFAFELRD